MYHLLLNVTSDENEESRQPQAWEPELCRTLVFEREPSRSVSQLTFYINPVSLRLDYLHISNVAGGMLCSQRFIEVLTSESIPFTVYPAQLVDETTGKPLAEHYFFWIPQWIEDAVDWEHSEVWINPETGKRHFTKLILTAACEIAAPPLFQSAETGRYFVHDRVRIRLQAAAGLTGVGFAPLDAAYLPLLGIRRLELEHLLQEHPDDVKRWCDLSDLLEQLRRYHAALEAIDRALILKSDLARAWWTRGHLLRELGRPQEALEAFKQTVRIDPQSGAWQEYSAVLRELGSAEEALAIAERLVQVRSKAPQSWYELGVAHASLGHYEIALQAFERALTLGRGPRIDETYLGKGEMLYQLGRYVEALETYMRGLKLKPWKKAMWEGKAKVLRALGRDGEAKAAEQEVRELEQRRERNLRARPV